ncbi:hypothetical protein [Thiocystis violascens]|uniref:Uncharacterized protein n=1 Tax=Thiocystis violascens (strain ATCC 17096 / DSM 198 / 6111) TaxID=765911 RepID=I3Y7T6_THIV6|nr:hypothetical protein [Thiocystis violascens]AFL73054.1 hypothetical protein Thivi_1023 [Thiocystis violascens DSM 198]
MNLCPKCNPPAWTFAVIFILTSVIAFVTWLMLGLSMTSLLPRAGITSVVFLAVGATFVHYVMSCIKRHCRHDEQSARA